MRVLEKLKNGCIQSDWASFVNELTQILRFWLLGVTALFIYRVVFIGSFANEISNWPTWSSMLKLFYTGFRFDSMVVSYFCVVPFAALLVLAPWGKCYWVAQIRRVVECLFVVATVLICLVALNYYVEFQNLFDNNLFLGLLEEDLGTVFEMICAYKNPVLYVLLGVLLIFVGLKVLFVPWSEGGLYRWLLRVPHQGARGVVVLLAVYVMVAGLRGSFGKDLIKVRNSAVTADLFLNKAVLNPYKALNVAYKDYKEATRLGDCNPHLNERMNGFMAGNQVKEYLIKQAPGAQIAKPKQIFLVIMESYDAWALQEKYRPLHVADELAEIADKGMTFMNFLPAYNATIYAFNAIVGGIPHFGVNVSQVGKQDKEYVCSIFDTFERLGYITNFFYGGYLSWQNIDRFSDYLGCDHMYSAADIGEEMTNCWGVDDEFLFDFVLDQVEEEAYSLNVILTTSYHPPFEIDVYAKGFPYHSVEDLPEEVRGYYDEQTMPLNELGHRWYGDYAIGQFMQRAEELYPEALYAFTGDHFARKFINRTPNLYEQSAVPFVLYGSGVPAQQLDTPGSHIDICPTLVDLIAPKDFTYYSFGSSMLNPVKSFAMGYNKLITRSSIYVEGAAAQIQKMDLDSEEIEVIEHTPFEENYQWTLGLAWQYIAKGNKIAHR